MLLGLICNGRIQGADQRAWLYTIAFVERNNSIAYLASLVKLLIKLLKIYAPSFCEK